jgi:hypothetical protein
VPLVRTLSAFLHSVLSSAFILTLTNLRQVRECSASHDHPGQAEGLRDKNASAQVARGECPCFFPFFCAFNAQRCRDI